MFCVVGVKPWSNIMGILDEKEGGDTELLTYAMTLVNKVRSIKNSELFIKYSENYWSQTPRYISVYDENYLNVYIWLFQ